MKEAIILDTGPLVALFNRRDHYHQWSIRAFGKLKGPLVTCEAVFVEACHLIKKGHGNPNAILGLLERQVLTIPFRLEENRFQVSNLINKYADVAMDLADACLVRMSELLPKSRVLTLDRDFLIYRRHRRKKIPLIFPHP